MTQHDMMAKISDLGLTVSVKDGEIRINHKGGKEETAYYTTDRDYAVATAQAMIRPGGTPEDIRTERQAEYDEQWPSLPEMPLP